MEVLFNTRAKRTSERSSQEGTFSPSPVHENHLVLNEQKYVMNLPGLKTSAYTKFGIKEKRKPKLKMSCDSYGVGDSPSRGRIWAGKMVHPAKALAVQTL